MIRTCVISELGDEALEAARRQHRQGRHRRSSTSPCSRRASSAGFGFHEAPRGTLSHWVVIEDGKIEELPGGRAVDVERRARATRRGSRGRTRRRSSATRSPTPSGRSRCCAPIHSFDPVHRLRDPHARRRGQRDRPRQGALACRVSRRVRVLGLGNVLMGDDARRPVGDRGAPREAAKFPPRMSRSSTSGRRDSTSRPTSPRRSR